MSEQSISSADVEATEKDASLLLAEESFRHSWDMSDERRIDGEWVAGLCCDCGAFVPFGHEIAHVASALAPLLAVYIQTAEVRALQEAADRADSEGHHWSGAAAHAFFEMASDFRASADRIETEGLQ